MLSGQRKQISAMIDACHLLQIAAKRTARTIFIFAFLQLWTWQRAAVHVWVFISFEQGDCVSYVAYMQL